MTSVFVPDNAPNDFGAIDNRYYQRQVPPASLTNDRAFEMAVAAAKDKARVALIKAVRAADEAARDSRGSAVEELSDIWSGQQKSGQVTFYSTRSIDGVDGAKDEVIKL
jgi:hypothetical protein